jgi:hypothetical protein
MKTRKVLWLIVWLSWMVFPAVAQNEERIIASSPTPVSIPTEVKQRLQTLLPDKIKLQAETNGATEFYAANLYEYIDGGADAYHLYDFVALIHQEYKAQKAEITVDIYDMGDPQNAFGIYSVERSPNYDFLPIGAEGYASDYALNFLQDRYYVKLSAFSQEGKADAVLEAFAREISAQIKTGKTLPDLFAFFPAENRIVRSEKFLLKSAMGHEFLAPACQASYNFQGRESILMLAQAASPEQAAERIARLKSYFQESGKVESLPRMGEAAWRGSNSYEGEMWFLTKGVYTLLLINPPPNGEAVLGEFAAKVK